MINKIKSSDLVKVGTMVFNILNINGSAYLISTKPGYVNLLNRSISPFKEEYSFDEFCNGFQVSPENISLYVNDAARYISLKNLLRTTTFKQVNIGGKFHIKENSVRDPYIKINTGLLLGGSAALRKNQLITLNPHQLVYLVDEN